MTTPFLVKAGQYIQRIGATLAQKSIFSVSAGPVAAYKGFDISHIRLSTDSLYTIWRNHGDVYSCVKELCDNTGSNGYTWQNIAKPDADPNAQSVSYIEEVLKKNYNFRKLKKRLIRDLKVTGNAYLHIQKNLNGKVIGVDPVDPRTMNVVTTEYGDIIKWIQRIGTRIVEFEPGEIAHWKTEDDPNSPVLGLSPLEPIVWEVRTDLAAVVTNYSFFQNDARPAVQYILDEGLSEDQAKDTMDYIREQLKGAENQHKSIAIKGVKEIKQLSINPRDMEFNVLRRFTTEKVCSVYSVPKTILGYTDGVNYSTNEGQMQKFIEATIMPLEEELAEFINKVVAPLCGVADIGIKFNQRRFDTETSVREDLKCGIITINEAREKRGMEYYDPAEKGEMVDMPIIYAGSSAIPLVDVGVDPQPVQIDPNVPDPQAKALVDALSKRYLYGRNKA